MKVWTKVHIKDHSRQVELITDALANYLYRYGPLSDIYKKYKVSQQDIKDLDKYTINRIGGLLMLYLANDKKRINDIVNKYNISNQLREEIIPEIEGYIEK